VTGFCLIGGQQYSNPVLSLLLLCARHFFFFSKMKKVGSQSPSSRGPERAAPDPRNGPMSARDTSSSNNTIEDTNVLSEVVENWVSAIEVWSDELSAENGSVSWDAPLTAVIAASDNSNPISFNSSETLNFLGTIPTSGTRVRNSGALSYKSPLVVP
jgi:hypothetical protein